MEIEKGPVDLFPVEPTEPDFRKARRTPYVIRGLRGACTSLCSKKVALSPNNFHSYQANRDHFLSKKIERETGIEPATFSLARRRSTTEPLAHKNMFAFSATTSDNIPYDQVFVNHKN